MSEQPDFEGVATDWRLTITDDGVPHWSHPDKYGVLWEWKSGRFVRLEDPFTTWVREVREKGK